MSNYRYGVWAPPQAVWDAMLGYLGKIDEIDEKNGKAYGVFMWLEYDFPFNVNVRKRIHRLFADHKLMVRMQRMFCMWDLKDWSWDKIRTKKLRLREERYLRRRATP